MRILALLLLSCLSTLGAIVPPPATSTTVYVTNLPGPLQPLSTNNAVNLTNIPPGAITGLAASVYSNQTLTISGTANQITSSAGAQNLTANRTVTLSTPQNIDTGATVQFSTVTLTGGTNYVAGNIRHDGGFYSPTNMTAAPSFNVEWSMTNVAASYTMALPIGVDTTLLMFERTLYTVTNSAGPGSPITITIPAGFKKSSWWGTNVSAVVVTNATMAWLTCRPGETNIYWEQGY